MIYAQEHTMEQLTLVEVQRLEVLESVIDAGMQTFVHVGNALLEIRENRLYRKSHGTFEDYCRQRWGMERANAYRLIDAAKVVGNLSPMGDISPATERQARPLTSLAPDEQREVWSRAVDTAPNGKVTAAHVQTVVDEYRQNAAASATPDVWYVGDNNMEAIADEVKKPHVSHNSGNNEWYTPAEYIAAARSVMGGIDLDPATSETANTVVNAAQIFTAQDDGLSQQWNGRVWMNPPYASDLVGRFAEKLVCSFVDGDVSEGIVLVNNATETGWFMTLVSVASAVVFPRSRVRFWQPDGKLGAPLQGQAIIYFGARPEAFRNHFEAFGWGATL